MATNRLALQLGWRFLRARNSNRFVSFISASSVVGVALGVSVLILVLSAMNGFERELKERLLAVVPHAEVTSMDMPIHDWPTMVDDAASEPGVVGAAPFVVVEGMLQRGEAMKPVTLRGVDPRWEELVSAAGQYMPREAWASLSEPGANLVLGKALAKSLGVAAGDRIGMMIPNWNNGNFSGSRTVFFTVSGLFDLGGEIDRTLAFTNLAHAQQIAGIGQAVSGVRIKVADLFAAPQLIRNIGFRQAHPLYLSDWTRSQGHLYSDIQLIRTLTYLVLVLVVAVASFNIICSLVMSVRDKQEEIAILRTMGLGQGSVMLSFMVQGAVTGAIGCLIGAVLGSLVASKLSALVSVIERLLGTRFLSGDIYFIDFIPSELKLMDVVLVSLVAFIVTLIATWYPAWKASRMKPAEVL